MALLNIVEFKTIQAYWSTASAQIAMTPCVTTQSITISAANTVSVQFSANTNIIRLQCDTNCAVEFSQTATTIATATVTSMPLIAGQPEYFGVTPSFCLAVCTT